MLSTVLRLLIKRDRLQSKHLWSKMKTLSLSAANGSGDRMTYCKNVQLYSTLKQSVVHDLCADIKIDEMRAKHEREAQSCSLADTVQDEMEQRLSNALKQFNERQSRFLKIVKLEHSFLFSEGYSIPSPEFLTNRNWLEAMTMSSMEERLVYYCNLERIAQKQRSKERKEVRSQSSEIDADGESSDSIFLHSLSGGQLERLTNHRLASAMLHGSFLVVDLGFDDNHLSTDIDPIVSQLWNLYLVNGANREPFHLIFTNCSFTGPIYRHLLLTCMVKASFVLATFTERSHTDIFPQQNLVYLSSQSKEDLKIVNRDHIYILGAYHDPLMHKKLSYAKAKKENLCCLRLPINQHVKWAHQAHKDLDLDSMVDILLSVRDDGLWKKAFISVVPTLVNQNA